MNIYVDAEIKIFCEGEEVETKTYSDIEFAEIEFYTYPVDDMADHIELWEYDPEEDEWCFIDERDECPSP